MNSIETLRPAIRSWSGSNRSANSNPRLSSLGLPGTCAFKWIGPLVACTIILALVGIPFPALAQSTITKITTGPVVTDAADGQGCAWVDFNNDGLLDLYVTCNRTGKSLLYRNDGNGVFTKITTGPIVNAGVGPVSASWADLDNDGHIDLFVSEQNGGPGLLFRQQADGTFTRTTLAPSRLSWGSAWADYDNDGFADLLVAETTRTSLWHNNAQGSLVVVTNSPFATNISNIVWGDYDNDGNIDVFLTGGTDNGRLYRNKGSGVFEQVTSGALAQSANGTGAARGDYDNDGYPDLFMCRLDVLNFQEPLPSFLFHNNGDGTFTQIKLSPFTDDTGFAVSCSWGDYDNDGWLDLIVTDFGGGQNRLYHNKGDGTFERVLSGSIATEGGSSTGAAWGDYDHDGFLDLFIANSTAGGGDSDDYLYHNDGNSNSWITVKCVGTVSNRSAIGAKVRVKATINGKTFWQLREINTGDGWSNPPLEAHFGLDDATNIETLRIEWPSGTVQELQHVAAKQYLTVAEPSRLLINATNGIPQLTLQGGRGFQYDIETSTNSATWSHLDLITITNLNGAALITDTNAAGPNRRFYRAVLP